MCPAAPTDEWINERMHSLGVPPHRERPTVWQGTTNYMSIEWDHIVELNGDLFLIRCKEHEGRFGLDDQPKFWVKRVINLSAGKAHILKLAIQERFKVSVGRYEFLCFRNPEKEEKAPDLVR
jgi:hypothetical protein